jgi:hypothetical protein
MIIYLVYMWSVADLLLTCMYYDNDRFYEANPIAREIMEHGLLQLCYFKLIFASLVCCIYYYFFCIRKQYEAILKLSFYFIFVIWAYCWINFLINIWR